MATTLWLRDTTENGIGGGYRDLDQAGAGSVSFPGTALDVTPGSGGSADVLWGVWVTGYPTAEFNFNGDVDFLISAGESSNSTNIGIKCKVFKRDAGGTETEIADFPRSGELTTTSAERDWSGDPPSTTIGTTDRLVFKFYTYPQGSSTYGSGFGRMRFDAVSGAGQGESRLTIDETVTFSFDTGIEGTASLTEAADTVSAAGALAIAGTLTKTEAADTATATGALAIAGTASITEAPDSVAGTGGLAIAGAADLTEAVDTVSAAADLAIAGTADLTEAADTVAAEGALTERLGTADLVEQPDTLAATGELPLEGAAAITETADTTAAAGELAIEGAAALTEAADTADASGLFVDRAAEADITEAADTVDAAGALAIAGAVDATEAADTGLATGEIAIAGSATLTEAADTVAGTGGSTIAGAAAITEQADSVAAAAGLAITGTAAINEARDTASAEAVFGAPNEGTASITEAPDTLDAVMITVQPWGWRNPPAADLAALVRDLGATPEWIVELRPYDAEAGQTVPLRWSSHGLRTDPQASVPNEHLRGLFRGFTDSSALWSGDEIFGAGPRNSAQLVADNTVGQLDTYANPGSDGERRWHFRRREARILVGHRTWRYDEFLPVFTGHIEEPDFGPDAARFTLYDAMERLERPAQERAYPGDLWSGNSSSSVTVGTGAKSLTLPDGITNGTFASSLTGWTAGTGWAQSGGAAVKTAGTASSLAQTVTTAPEFEYRIRATLTRTAGTLQVTVDGQPWGEPFAASGTIDVVFLAPGATSTVAFVADAAFAGTLDDVTVRQHPAAAAGDFAVIALVGDLAGTWMWGTVDAYDPATGELDVTVDTAGGSGSHSSWQLWLRPLNGGPDMAGKAIPEPLGICRRVEPDYLGLIQGHYLYRAAEAAWSVASATDGAKGIPISASFPPPAGEVYIDEERGAVWAANDVTPDKPLTVDILDGGGEIAGRRIWAEPGAYQFVVPSGVTTMTFATWGGGGGGADGADGGGGGFVLATIDVTPGEALTIVNGAGGAGHQPFGVTLEGGGASAIAHGGRAGSTGGGQRAGDGGGASGVKRGSQALLIAPGGGGATYGKDGGAGGGLTGLDGEAIGDEAGKGGGESAGGAAGVPYSASPSSNSGQAGAALLGGKGGDDIASAIRPGGGGGGGRFGGGGGAGGSDIDNRDHGPGGGGSALVPAGGSTEAGSGREPGGDDNGNWVSPAARGGSGSGAEANGQPGRVVASWGRPAPAADPTAGSLVRRLLRDRMGYRLVETDETVLGSITADAGTRTFTASSGSFLALGIAAGDTVSWQGLSANADVNLTVAAVAASTLQVKEAIADIGSPDTSFVLTAGEVDGTALAALDLVTDPHGHMLRDSTETGAAVLDRILGSIGWARDVTPAGLVTFVAFGPPADVATAELTEARNLFSLQRRPMGPSAWRVRMGAERCWRVHQANEIVLAASDAERKFVLSEWRENTPDLGTNEDVRTKDLGAIETFVPTSFAFRASVNLRAPQRLAVHSPGRQAYEGEVGMIAFALTKGQTVAVTAPTAGLPDPVRMVVLSIHRDAAAGTGRVILWG